MSSPREHAKYGRLMAAARALPRLKVAVAHPCDEASLGAVVEAADLGLIEPILVGPPLRLTAAAQTAHVDLARFRVVPSEHSHDSAAKAVALVRAARPRR